VPGGRALTWLHPDLAGCSGRAQKKRHAVNAVAARARSATKDLRRQEAARHGWRLGRGDFADPDPVRSYHVS
jgi:hypothetical protein